MLRIKLNSVMVEDQEAALQFYTEVLGFKKKHDIPVGEVNGKPLRWITVVSTGEDGREDLELALEPNQNPAGKTFQKALFDQKIPATAFESTDIEADFQRLKKAGVVFTKEPTKAGPVMMAVFADTCGNLIQIHQLI